MKVDTKDLVSVATAALTLNVSPATIRNLIDAGRLTATRVGHAYLVTEASVVEEFDRRYPNWTYIRREASDASGEPKGR